MRPKSSATVVVVLRSTLDTSSTAADIVVIAASVVSGSISLMAPTNVVLPAPKPPATTIFTGIGAGRAERSEGAEAMEHPFQKVHVGCGNCCRCVVVRGHHVAVPQAVGHDPHHALAAEVTHQHSGDADG